MDISSRMERHPTLHTPAWPKFSPFSVTASFRSPDLTPPDYSLWGYLKGRVYQNKPRTIDDLKANITEEIQAVTADVLARNFRNIARRVQSCLDANGGHFHVMMSYDELDFPTFATRRLHACHHARAPSGGRWNRVGEKYQGILPKFPTSTLHLGMFLHAVKLRHGADGFISPPKEGVLRIFFALKKSDGFGRV